MPMGAPNSRVISPNLDIGHNISTTDINNTISTANNTNDDDGYSRLPYMERKKDEGMATISKKAYISKHVDSPKDVLRSSCRTYDIILSRSSSDNSSRSGDGDNTSDEPYNSYLSSDHSSTTYHSAGDGAINVASSPRGSIEITFVKDHIRAGVYNKENNCKALVKKEFEVDQEAASPKAADLGSPDSCLSMVMNSPTVIIRSNKEASSMGLLLNHGNGSAHDVPSSKSSGSSVVLKDRQDVVWECSGNAGYLRSKSMTSSSARSGLKSAVKSLEAAFYTVNSMPGDPSSSSASSSAASSASTSSSLQPSLQSSSSSRSSSDAGKRSVSLPKARPPPVGNVLVYPSGARAVRKCSEPGASSGHHKLDVKSKSKNSMRLVDKLFVLSPLRNANNHPMASDPPSSSYHKSSSTSTAPTVAPPQLAAVLSTAAQQHVPDHVLHAHVINPTSPSPPSDYCSKPCISTARDPSPIHNIIHKLYDPLADPLQPHSNYMPNDSSSHSNSSPNYLPHFKPLPSSHGSSDHALLNMKPVPNAHALSNHHRPRRQQQQQNFSLHRYNHAPILSRTSYDVVPNVGTTSTAATTSTSTSSTSRSPSLLNVRSLSPLRRHRPVSHTEGPINPRCSKSDGFHARAPRGRESWPKVAPSTSGASIVSSVHKSNPSALSYANSFSSNSSRISAYGSSIVHAHVQCVLMGDGLPCFTMTMLDGLCTGYQLDNHSDVLLAQSSNLVLESKHCTNPSDKLLERLKLKYSFYSSSSKLNGSYGGGGGGSGGSTLGGYWKSWLKKDSRIKPASGLVGVMEASSSLLHDSNAELQARHGSVMSSEFVVHETAKNVTKLADHHDDYMCSSGSSSTRSALRLGSDRSSLRLSNPPGVKSRSMPANPSPFGSPRSGADPPLHSTRNDSAAAEQNTSRYYTQCTKLRGQNHSRKGSSTLSLLKPHGSMSSIHLDTAWSDNNSNIIGNIARSELLANANISTPSFSSHKKELVAIVISVPMLGTNNIGSMAFDSGSGSDDGRSHLNAGKLLEDKRSWCVSVLLPRGDHGMPVAESTTMRYPYSSLIERWRSGGSCTCGGWDLGCGLTVLSSSQNNHVEAMRLKSVDHDCGQAAWTIFSQGSKQEMVFSLSPLNDGLYTVAFDRQLTPFNAFATVVAILHTRQLPTILMQSDAKLVSSSSSSPLSSTDE